MIKTLLATSFALLSGAAAFAYPIDPGFTATQVRRGGAYAIRSCSDTDVCYNETRSIISRFGNASADKVVQVNCDRRQVSGTRRAEIAEEFCPLAASGELAPAPFLQ